MTRLLILGWLAGCTSTIHQISVSDFTDLPHYRTPVTVEVEQLSVMGFERVEEGEKTVWRQADTSYVDDAWRELQEQCPGELGAISVETSTQLGFFHWRDRIRLRGQCVLQPVRPQELEGPPAGEAEEG